MSILFVELQAKWKKIQSFLDKSYIVKSSVGHIRTLDTKWANTDVKISDDFEPPFITIKDKHEVVNNLKSASKNRKVILAADDDREGEAIAWHCGDILRVDFNMLHFSVEAYRNSISRFTTEPDHEKSALLIREKLNSLQN